MRKAPLVDRPQPTAPELVPDKILQDLFDQGRQVGELARRHFPDGIFEATFEAAGVHVAIDILEKTATGHTLIEVKSSSSVKQEHIVDAAIQTWVARQAGLAITRVEIMHLNKEYRHPDVNSLLVRADITDLVEAFLPQVPPLVEDLTRVLAGPLPDKKIGAHCHEPRDCPFIARCWPVDPLHIRHLYITGPKKTISYMAAGIDSIKDLPAGAKLPFAARRQVKAIAEIPHDRRALTPRGPRRLREPARLPRLRDRLPRRAGLGRFGALGPGHRAIQLSRGTG